MTEVMMRIMGDNSLADGARLLALRLCALGEDDWHEVSHEAIARFLHGYPSSDTIRRLTRQLEVSGYLEIRPGGKGHPQAYRIIKDRSTADLKLTLRTGADLNTDRLGIGADLSVRSSRRDVVVEEEPPIVPLSPQAERAITEAGDKLEGCRGALRDYLRQRVPPDRQFGYVMSVVGWLNGISPGTWRLPDGSNLPPDQQTAALADALNDLAASKESSMKRPVGDPANLRTKINVLLKQGWNRERSSREAGSDGSRADGQVGGSSLDSLAHLGG